MPHQAKANFAALIESTDDYIWSVDLDYRLITFNLAAQRGLEADFGTHLAIGMSPDQFLPPAVAAAWPPLYERALKTGPFRVEFPFANGLFVEISMYPIVVDGKATGVSVFAKDISERKTAVSALKKAEKKYRDIFDGALEGIFQAYPDGRPRNANPAIAKLLGYESVDDLMSTVKNVATDIVADQSERAAYMKLLENHGYVMGFEGRFKRKDGSIIWVSINGQRVLNPDGSVSHSEGFVVDITERKRAEAALDESAESLREAQRIGGLGSYVLDLQSGVWTCSDVLEELLGIDHKFVRTLESWLALIHPEDRAMMDDYFAAEVLGQRKDFDKEYRLNRANDKQQRWLHALGRVEFSETGQPLKMRGVIKDITERKQAELTLRSSQEFALATIDALSTTLCVLDEAGAIIAVNRAWREFAEANRKTYNNDEVPEFDAHDRFNMQANYLDVCDATVGLEAAEAARFAAGIRAVLCGESKGFSQEYSCHSPDKERWFVGKVAPFFVDGPLRAAIEHIDITAIKEGEARLKEASQRLGNSEERYRKTFEQAAVGIAHTTFEGKLLRCNARFAEIIGYSPEDIPGLTIQQITAPEDLAQSLASLEKMGTVETGYETWEKRYVCKNGGLTWVRITTSIQRDSAGQPLHYIAVIEDINARKTAEERLAAVQAALQVSENRYRTAFQTSLDGVTINRVADGMFIDCNKAFLDTNGYERHEVLGRTSVELGIWPDPRDRKSFVDILRQCSTCRDLEVRLRKKTGELYWGLLSASLIELDGQTCMHSVVRDISDAKASAEKIRNLAFYDPLTGLPNRRLLLDRLQQLLSSNVHQGHMHALMLVDLDGFKKLNDTLGHQSGDLLLQDVAQRLTKCVLENDTVARLVGDEFVVMLEDLSETGGGAAQQAKTRSERVLAAIAKAYLIGGRECRLTASIGITIFGDGKEAGDEILRQADIAMGQSKADGSNTVRFFSPALQIAVNARAAMEADLRKAIDAEQFELYYQPQVEGTKLIGAESLIRWNHPERGFLLPGEFIAFAEDTGLIVPLGDWVLETACNQLATWAHRKESADLMLAVNISARQFRQPDFVEKVLAALERSGAEPHNLELELTESMLVDNIEQVIAKMTELKSYGLRFSLDDFGTGYSSLTYLKRLPLDQFKIDRSFVQDILADASSGAIAQTIISLSKAMGLPVIAEGVETEAQRDLLIGLGCHAFQGYLISRPLALKEFERLWLEPKGHPAPITIEPPVRAVATRKRRSIA